MRQFEKFVGRLEPEELVSSLPELVGLTDAIPFLRQGATIQAVLEPDQNLVLYFFGEEDDSPFRTITYRQGQVTYSEWKHGEYDLLIESFDGVTTYQERHFSQVVNGMMEYTEVYLRIGDEPFGLVEWGTQQRVDHLLKQIKSINDILVRLHGNRDLLVPYRSRISSNIATYEKRLAFYIKCLPAILQDQLCPDSLSFPISAEAIAEVLQMGEWSEFLIMNQIQLWLERDFVWLSSHIRDSKLPVAAIRHLAGILDEPRSKARLAVGRLTARKRMKISKPRQEYWRLQFDGCFDCVEKLGAEIESISPWLEKLFEEADPGESQYFIPRWRPGLY